MFSEQIGQETLQIYVQFAYSSKLMFEVCMF